MYCCQSKPRVKFHPFPCSLFSLRPLAIKSRKRARALSQFLSPLSSTKFPHHICFSRRMGMHSHDMVFAAGAIQQLHVCARCVKPCVGLEELNNSWLYRTGPNESYESNQRQLGGRGQTKPQPQTLGKSSGSCQSLLDRKFRQEERGKFSFVWMHSLDILKHWMIGCVIPHPGCLWLQS